MERKITFLLLVVLATTALVILAGCVSEQEQKTTPSPTQTTPPPSPITIRIKSGPTGTTWYAQASAIAGILSREIPGSSATVETGSAISNIVLIEDGKTDLAFTFICLLPAATKGEVISGDYFRKPVKNVSVLLYTTRAAYVLITTADKGWNTVEDIKGKPIRYVTYPPGFVARYMTDMILDAHGITLKDIESWGGSVIIVNRYDDAVDLLAKGQADLIAYTAATYGQSPALVELEAQKKFVFLEPTDSGVQKIVSKFPVLIETVKPGLYKSITKETKVVNDITVYLVPKDLPENVVYTLAKLIVEHRDEIASVQAEFGVLKPQDFLSGYGKPGQPPLHPGAVKYFKEIGVLK
ncbi:MAG: TAXI family TRAP transporter solute-binding subunit [Archaeoglobaceae archaeon]|nr:TAXI family TRAP transporter solute-binding subunit [Archaeoglobaceae archaeon]MDW8127666.1 TAXI family TRAP transporter solute-binding subunit [Archaeoglobaceae archaeon]